MTTPSTSTRRGKNPLIALVPHCHSHWIGMDANSDTNEPLPPKQSGWEMMVVEKEEPPPPLTPRAQKEEPPVEPNPSQSPSQSQKKSILRIYRLNQLKKHLLNHLHQPRKKSKGSGAKRIVFRKQWKHWVNRPSRNHFKYSRHQRRLILKKPKRAQPFQGAATKQPRLRKDPLRYHKR